MSKLTRVGSVSAVTTATGGVKQDMVLVEGKPQRHTEGNSPLDFYSSLLLRGCSDCAAAASWKAVPLAFGDAVAHGVEVVDHRELQ